MTEDLVHSHLEEFVDSAPSPTTVQHVSPANGIEDDKENSIHLKLSYALGTRYCGHNLVEFLSENVVIYPAAHHLSLFHTDNNVMEFFHHTRNVQSVQCFHVSPNRELIAVAEVHHNSIPMAQTISGLAPGIPPVISPQMTSHFRDQQSQHILCIYKASTRTRIRSIPLAHSANIVACSFSADNKYLAMLEDTPSHMVTYWKISNSKLIASYKCPSRGTRIHINPNNCSHISVSGPMILKYWLWTNNDFKIGNFVPQAREHEHFVDHVWIKEYMIAVSERGMLLSFRTTADCTTVDLVHSSRCHQPSFVRMECIAAHVKGFVLGGSAGFFSIYEFSDDPKDPFTFIRSVSVGDIAFECLTVSPSVETIIACTKSHELVTFSMSVLDTLQEDRLDFRELIRHGHQIGAVLQVDTCIQRPVIASCGSDKTVRIWNYELRHYELLHQCSEEPIALTLHPSGFQVIVAYKERVRMYNILQDSLKQTREIAIKSCRVVRYANGGHLFACASGLTVTTYHTYTVEPAHTFSGHIGAVKSLCWSSDDLFLLSAGHDGAVYRWIITTGTRCEEMLHVVKQCQYSALVVDHDDPKLVVAAGSDGKLREILSGEETKIVDLPQGVSVTFLALMTESKRLFAATNIGSILVYSWPLSSKIIGEYFAHTESITTMRITEDSECLVTSSEDGSICIFALNNSHLFRSSIVEIEEQKIMEAFQRQTGKKTAIATFADAVLVAREDIDDRQTTLVEMQQNYDQLKADVEFALHRKENEWIERLRVIKEESETLVIQERVRYEELETRYQQAARKHLEELSQKEANHVKLTQEVENQYERKLAQEIARYDALSETLEQTRQRCEALIESQDNQHRTILHSERKSSYARAKDQSEVIKRLHEDLRFNHSKFEEVLHQEETEYEQELQMARSEHGKLLDIERQNTAIKQGQLNAANTKLESLAKKMQELKATSHARDIVLSTEKAKVEKLEEMLVQYEKHFEHCKYSINEREKAIAGLKSSNRILENFRSVLYHRIDNLEFQQEPMQNHVSSLESHISEMQTELAEDFKSKAAMQQDLERKDAKVNSLLHEVKMLRQSSLKKDYSVSEMTREFTRLAQLTNYKDLDAAVKDAYRVFVIGEIVHKRPPKAVVATALIQPENKSASQLKGGQSPSNSSPTTRDGKVVFDSNTGRTITTPTKSKIEQRSQQIQPLTASSSSDETLGYDCKQAVDESMKNMEFMSKSILTLRAALESTKNKADRIRRDSVAEGSFLIEECNKLRKDNKVLGMRVRELESMLHYAHIGSGSPSSTSKRRLRSNSSSPQLTSPQKNDLTIDTGTINSPSKSISTGSGATPSKHLRELRKGGSVLPFARLEMDRDKRTGSIVKIDELNSVIDRQRSEIQRLQNQVQLLLSEEPEEFLASSRHSMTATASYRQMGLVQPPKSKILRPITANPHTPILHSSFVLSSPDHPSGINGK